MFLALISRNNTHLSARSARGSREVNSSTLDAAVCGRTLDRRRTRSRFSTCFRAPAAGGGRGGGGWERRRSPAEADAGARAGTAGPVRPVRGRYAPPLACALKRDFKSISRAARDFDLGGGFQHSGSYPMVFQHSVETRTYVVREDHASTVATLALPPSSVTKVWLPQGLAFSGDTCTAQRP